MKPEGAIQGIIQSDESDESDERAFSKKHLANNWSRYDEESEEERFGEDPNLLDFQALAQQPSGLASHFQFSSEKYWGEREEQDPEEHPARKECSKYFTMNVKLLNAGLQTIPFYKRMDYDKSMFSEFDIHRMDAEAEMAEEKYKTVLKEQLKNPSRAQSAQSSKKSKSRPGTGAPPATPAAAPKPSQSTDEKDEALDELLNMTNKVSELEVKDEPTEATAQDAKSTEAEAEKPPQDASNPGTVETKEDIQQWLDDILDE